MVLAAVAAPLIGTGPAAAAGPVARRADSLANTLGVNVVTSRNSGAQGDHAKAQAALARLGARHIRTRLFANRPDQYAVLRNLAASGIRSDLVAGDPTHAGGTPEQLVQIAATQLPSAVDSFEGVNEWNFSGRTNWAAEVRSHQKRLYAAVKSNSRLSRTPVLGPAFSANASSQRATVGDLSAYLDYGNNHLYPGGFAPSRIISDQIASARTISGSKKVMFTETGFHDAMHYDGPHNPTPDAVSGVYMPRLLLEHYLRGTPRMFAYNLIDDNPDPGLTDREDHFGLLRNDYSPKPAYTALRNLLQLTADPGPAFTTRSLNYSLTGAPADLRTVLLQKRDGRFYLVLWRDVSIYDPVKRATLNVPAVNVGIRLASPAGISVFQPSRGLTALSSLRSSSLSVSLAGAVDVVQITP